MDSTTETKRTQPPWHKPQHSPSDLELPPLKLYNSLTRKKEDFIPIKGRKVKWYTCGPTVYDDAHVGHARNYVSTDIIRRVLAHYFNFDVEFIMNITDVDDKIIIRGRQMFLLAEYKAGRLDSVLSTLSIADIRTAALESYAERKLPLMPKGAAAAEIRSKMPKEYTAIMDWHKLTDAEAKIKMYIETVLQASQALTANQSNKVATEEDMKSLDDVIMPFLDGLYLENKFGRLFDPADHAIFTQLTKKYEQRFSEDMRALNVMDPDGLTRVTEYGRNIVDFVQRIEQNQCAYPVDGSVYFDINAFEAAKNQYMRLEPENYGNKKRSAEGEGALTVKPKTRSDADFVLWKKSKFGEPSWSSPWGEGRPGWHIECSAMASDKLGEQMDIHSGGIDLAFPHHDNELAQSEAYWNKEHQHQRQWVNYFLHMGHLSVAGAKMSKSLKNFTSIRDSLSGDYTSRGLRIVFLMGVWKDAMEITPGMRAEGVAWEEKLNNFFIKAKGLPYDSIPNAGVISHHGLDRALQKAQADTNKALCDSIDTSTVIKVISDLITEHNVAGQSQETASAVLNSARWITSIVTMLGLNGQASIDDSAIGWSGIDIPAEAMPIVTSLSNKRDTLRRKAIVKEITREDLTPVAYPEQELTEERRKAEAPFKTLLDSFNQDLALSQDSKSLATEILKLSDRIRDVDLFNLDVYLEDREGDQPALIRPVTRDLRIAKHEKERREAEKQRAKDEREKKAAEKAAEKAHGGKLSHLEMFRTKEYVDEYSVWDDKGIPTKDKKGEDVAKNRRKKFDKEWEKQKKKHEEWLKAEENAS